MEPDAVIFDWGGTLTRWHDIDFHAESLALAHAVGESEQLAVHAEALHRANQVVWGRSRDHQQSATIADLFTEAGLDHDPELLRHYYEFWEPHTYTDPEVGPVLEALRAEFIQQYGDRFANPYIAAERGMIDAVIPPRDTRKEVIRALRLLHNKRESLPPKKHGNIPL